MMRQRISHSTLVEFLTLHALIRLGEKAHEMRMQLAYEDFNDGASYAMQYGRGISRNLCERFIRMYVNNDTIDTGDEGLKALEMFYQKAEMEVSPIDILR